MSSCPAMTVSESTASPWWELPARSARTFAAAVVSNVWVLLACKAIIGCVSAFDTYLTMKYVISLETYEQNPIGRWLMGLDSGPVSDTQQIAAFITAKFLGTILVLLAIQGVAFWRVPLAGMIAIPVAAFQLSLVGHLLFGIG
jgi:hypothetical protein